MHPDNKEFTGLLIYLFGEIVKLRKFLCSANQTNTTTSTIALPTTTACVKVITWIKWASDDDDAYAYFCIFTFSFSVEKKEPVCRPDPHPSPSSSSLTFHYGWHQKMMHLVEHSFVLGIYVSESDQDTFIISWLSLLHFPRSRENYREPGNNNIMSYCSTKHSL